MLVERTKASVTKIAGIFFYPGMNKIKPQDEKAVNESPVFQSQVAAGLMKIVEIKKAAEAEIASDKETDEDPKANDETTTDIGEMTAADARKVIRKTLILSDLKAMKSGEKRGSVLDAIDKQIQKLKEAGEGK